MFECLIRVVRLPVVAEALRREQQPEQSRQYMRKRGQGRCSSFSEGTLAILRDRMQQTIMRLPSLTGWQDSVQKHCPVYRVSLYRLETGISNDLSELFFSRCVCAFGQHYASDIVAAEAQTNLEHFESLRLEI